MMPLIPEYTRSQGSRRQRDPAKVSPDLASPRKQHWAPSTSLPSRPAPSRPYRVRSKSIPIQNLQRTPSELRLHEDEELADYRDYVMFTRIVDGMVRSQEQTSNKFLRRENDRCLAHVIGTRKMQVESSLSPQDSPVLISGNDDEYMGGIFDLEL